MMDNEKFLAIRCYLNMNQNQFARYLGIAPSTVGRIETGSLKVSYRLRGKIASSFNFTDEFIAFYKNFIRTND